MTESFIQCYDNILSEDVCHTLIETSKLFDKDNKGIKHQYGDRNYFRIKNDLYDNIIQKVVNDALYEVYNKYRDMFPTNDRWEDTTFKWKIHHTPIGGYIDWHNDLGGNSTREEPWRRKNVFIIYLNDMNEGELQFKYFPDFCILPKVGRALMMPVGWPFIHKADRLILQEKYILTGFFYNTESALLL